MTEAVLSEKWRGTGPYLQALSGAALLLSATCWLDRAFDSFRRQNVAFLLEASVHRHIDLTHRLPIKIRQCGGRCVGIRRVGDPVLLGILPGDFRRLRISSRRLSAGVPDRTGCDCWCAGFSGASIHQLPVLELRLPAYAVLMVIVILSWIRFGGGTDIIRLLMQSRVRDGADG